jgi:hypothetical protein
LVGQFEQQGVLSDQKRSYLVILGAWNLWNHQNMCVFDGAVPDLNSILSTTREDLQLWSVAGAEGISSLLAPATT